MWASWEAPFRRFKLRSLRICTKKINYIYKKWKFNKFESRVKRQNFNLCCEIMWWSLVSKIKPKT